MLISYYIHGMSTRISGTTSTVDEIVANIRAILVGDSKWSYDAAEAKAIEIVKPLVMTDRDINKVYRESIPRDPDAPLEHCQFYTSVAMAILLP